MKSVDLYTSMLDFNMILTNVYHDWPLQQGTIARCWIAEGFSKLKNKTQDYNARE